MDFCASTRFTSKACIVLDQRRMFLGCDVNPEVLSAPEADFVLAFVSQALNKRLDTNGRGEIQAAADVSADEISAFLARKIALVGKVSPGLDVTQLMPGHIPQLLSAL